MARFRRSRRGVLEGLPLSVLISIFVIAIGTVLVLSLFSYARMTSLSQIVVSTPAGTTTNGFINAAPTQLKVTAWAQSGGVLGGVTIVLNGSSISGRALTSANGSAFFWIVPVLHYHASSGELTVTGIYLPSVSLASPPQQTTTVTLMVLS
ncbi:MAG: hypothetical protein KGJ23_01255 [Euryarchaeota archaeon]|nr:hypothetical protein [Euryarchaeota archaeon]MDE1835225.1 hypothetical protein [Euryarchaeota archaeon]MDE1880082.1 hypothetical protein [Euryarchaeota archaeon]MDE2043521.1 hypothetical protein [Thermoplasmata archaeon]